MENRLTLPNPLLALAFLAVAGLSMLALASPYPALALLPALGLLLFLVIAHNPRLGLYAVIFLIPFGAYRGLSGGGWQEFVRAHWIIAFLLILVLFFQDLPSRRISERLRSKFWLFIGLYFLVNIISAAFSRHTATTVENLLLLPVGFLFTALVMLLLDERSLRDRLPWVVAVSISISVATGVLEVFGGVDLLPGGSEENRALGMAQGPNNLSLMVLFALPMLVHLCRFSASAGGRLLSIGLIVLGFAGIVATYSRGGMLVMLCVLALLLFENRRILRPKHLGFFLIGLAVVLMLVATLVPQSYWQRQKSILTAQDRAMTRRLSYLVVGWDLFQRSPLIGHGPGSYREMYAETDYARAFYRKGDTLRRFAHNTYLEVLAGTGLLGLALFLAIVILALRNFSDAKRRYLERGNLLMANLAGHLRVSYLAVLLYFFFFSDMYHKYFLLALGLSHVIWLAARSRDASPQPDAGSPA